MRKNLKTFAIFLLFSLQERVWNVTDGLSVATIASLGIALVGFVLLDEWFVEKEATQ